MTKTSRARLAPITVDQVKQAFDLPLNEAAIKLGRSPSKLKMELKELKVKRWPYRRVNAIKEKIRCLRIKEEQLKTQNAATKSPSPYKSQLSILEQELNYLIDSSIEGYETQEPSLSPPESVATSPVDVEQTSPSLYKMSLSFLLN